MEDDTPGNEEFRFQTVGEQLRLAREAQGMELSDIAAKTRIPIRHLDAIESSNFVALPGTTYTLGFARNYARAMGLDTPKIVADLRAEMEAAGHSAYHAPTQSYEPTDPARVPPRAFAWTAAAIAVALLVAYLAWRSFTLGDPNGPEAPTAIAEKTPVTKSSPAAAAPDPAGQVVLTARDTVWVRIYDADNKRLYENAMEAGDSFSVPSNANQPMINTGRPQVIDVTIGGKPVAALGRPDIAVQDVGVSATALLARPPEPAAIAPARGSPNPVN